MSISRILVNEEILAKLVLIVGGLPGPFRRGGGIDDETNGPGGEVCLT